MIDTPRDDEWCIVAEAARRLRVTPAAIRHRIKRRTLEVRPNGNVGHLVRVPRPAPGTDVDTLSSTMPEMVSVSDTLIAELRDRIAELQARLASVDAERASLRQEMASEVHRHGTCTLTVGHVSRPRSDASMAPARSAAGRSSPRSSPCHSLSDWCNRPAHEAATVQVAPSSCREAKVSAS